jgi:hypothetical protein
MDVACKCFVVYGVREKVRWWGQEGNGLQKVVVKSSVERL